jgi:serine/threonine-protein kinase HipA
VTERLVVWLYGTPIGVLSSPNDRGFFGLEWLPDATRRWGDNSTILSTSLPIGDRFEKGPRRVRNFFENLLPEGPSRAAMARMIRVSESNTFELLAEFGRDCAGAVSLLPEDEAEEKDHTNGYRVLSSDELREELARIDVVPLGANPDDDFRPSLAGFQRKLLVGRTEDGQWTKPYGTAPSTWILKPDGDFPSAVNELICLNFARSCGIDVPAAELIEIDGVPTLAIQRYDRDGCDRIHQEDGLQTAGFPSNMKYESDKGPSLRQLSVIVNEFGIPDDVDELLRRTALHVVIGNADAHSKNVAFLHQPDDVGILIAPVYDIASTVSMKPVDQFGKAREFTTRLGQFIGGVEDVNEVTNDNLVSEGVSWGMNRRRARAIVDEFLDTAHEAATANDTELSEVLTERIERITAAR